MNNEEQSKIEYAAQEYAKQYPLCDDLFSKEDARAMIKAAYIEGAWSIQKIRIREIQQEIQQLELQVGQPLIK